MASELNLNAQIQRRPLVAVPQVGVPWWGRFNPALIGPATGFTSPPSEWDIVRVGPNLQPLPGLARVTRCERRMKLHRKEHPASDFETQTFQGWSVVEFDFKLELTTAAQLSSLQNWLSYIFPGAGDPPDPQSSSSVSVVTSTTNLVNPQNATASSTQTGQQIQVRPNTPKRPPIPVRCSHPSLLVHGVTACVFTWMNGPIPKSEDKPDIFVAFFKTVQFHPSKAVQTKTLKQTDTLPTNLGLLGPPGIGVLQPQWLSDAQQPNTGPSVSGGADPDGPTSYSNLLRPLP
jgi:hypothetical protein